jgi:DNA-directed RNA polymerase specialized sigma24 family protein
VNWERFEPYVRSLSFRLAGESDLRDDIAQEMRLRMCQELASGKPHTDTYIERAMRYAALNFCRRTAHDGPHDSSGRRQSNRIDPLDD